MSVSLQSNRCNLDTLSPKELVQHKEHEEEWGGYFIISGHERLVRMLIMPRRNYPVAIKRNTWKGRGQFFSDYGVQIRCVAEDQTSTVRKSVFCVNIYFVKNITTLNLIL